MNIYYKNKGIIIKKIVYILCMLTIIMICSTNKIYADVGDFESYDYDSYDSYSSYDYDSYDDDYYYSSNGSGDMTFGDLVIILITIGIVILISSRKQNKDNIDFYTKNKEVTKYDTDISVNQDEIVYRIQEIDNQFNSEDFLSWARDLFVKLQYAWSDRDWDAIRVFETNELYEQHLSQLDRYKMNKQINKIERVSVNWVKYLSFKQSGDKDIVEVVLNSKMTDYIINEETNAIIKGDKNLALINTYKLTFVRKKGVKTIVGENKLNTTNCPNCGAPTKITSSGKCEYCGSVITTGEYNWVLSNLEPYRG